MYLFLWCFYYNQKLLKIVKNEYTKKWVGFFSLKLKKLVQIAAKHTTTITFQISPGLFILYIYIYIYIYIYQGSLQALFMKLAIQQ